MPSRGAELADWRTFDAIGRAGLAHLPTPFHPLPRLTELLGGPDLWVKRDDCTGLAFGGNKARKLDYVLHRAIADGVGLVITSGAIQSNHARMTAAACARLGLECHLVFERPAGVDGALYARSGNVLLDALCGARVHVTEAGGAAALVEELAAGFVGRRPLVIPPGASNALGSLGYVEAARELVGQAEAAGLSVDRIMLATGSGGTLGGLLAGLAAMGSPIRPLAIALRDDPTAASRALACAHGALELAGLRATVSEADFDILFDYGGAGYSIVTPEIVDTLRAAARAEGLLFDPVYTGKMLVALFDLAKRGALAPGETVVLLHTGGTPALFAFDSIHPE